MRYGDAGGPSRFFKVIGHDAPSRVFFCGKAPGSERLQADDGTSHPTQKPLALMEYLCRLTRTPTGGVVLDPFMGSGSTGCAAVATDRPFVGIEVDPAYFEIAEKRIAMAVAAGVQLEIGQVSKPTQTARK